MNKIRREDQVLVLSGRDKGARGAVQRVILDRHGKPEKVVVQGVNNATHFVRPNPQKNEPGGVVKREMPLHVSKVAVLDPDSGLPARVKITTDGEGKKVRSYHISRQRRTGGAADAAPADGVAGEPAGGATGSTAAKETGGDNEKE